MMIKNEDQEFKNKNEDQEFKNKNEHQEFKNKNDDQESETRMRILGLNSDQIILHYFLFSNTSNTKINV